MKRKKERGDEMTNKKRVETAIKAFQASVGCNGRKTNTAKVVEYSFGYVVSLKRDGVLLADYAFHNDDESTPRLAYYKTEAE